MYLKNLTLKGFKSFAERTSMDFEPGVTVVVGPNGSGKSNVVDAIAWVLGVQAPSAVRSAKMDDVIFAGTVDKPALGRAEVSLTIDNHSRLLPVEFSEVKITRRLFRSGESQYAINGAPCRLLDITELLAGGGVGRHQHIVVSQGQIDAVLNARPEDRRAIIDEVAGVAVFRRRKERAEKRLADTEGDLTRETDLLREVRRRLRPLRKQAEAARRHGDLLSELTALRIHLAGREIERLRQALGANAELRASLAARERSSVADLERLAADISADEQTLAAHGGDELRDDLLRMESRRERARATQAVVAERLRGVQRERSAALAGDSPAALSAEATDKRVALADIDDQVAALAPELAQLDELEKTLAEDRAQLRRQVADSHPGAADSAAARAAAARSELAALQSSVASSQAEAHRSEARIAEFATGAALATAEAQLDLAAAGVAECAKILGRVEAAACEPSGETAAAAARLAEAEAALAAARSALTGIEADRKAAAAEAGRLNSRLAELGASIETDRARIAALEDEHPALVAAETEALEAARQAARRNAETQAELDERAAGLAAKRTATEVAAAGLSERRLLIVSRLEQITERLERSADLLVEAEANRVRLDATDVLLTRLAEAAEGRGHRADRSIAQLRERKQRQSAEAQALTQRLAASREALAGTESSLEELRSAASRAAVEQAELRTRLEGAVERLSADHGLRPDQAVAAPCPELPEEVDPARRVEMIESEIDVIGPVNPLALQEYDELAERHTFLQGQIDDIKAARRELQKVSSSIEAEIASVFAATFADVSVNFSRLFETLFPGGEGSITLDDPQDLLNTGIEISARPSGKKIRKLSLLSGGERALTALAFLFAVFRSRPSPFYVMDEVEVALDDVNLHRFLALVEEFRSEAQLLLVSHQKRTMEIADCLYGVSMRAGDSSKLISSKTASPALA